MTQPAQCWAEQDYGDAGSLWCCRPEGHDGLHYCDVSEMWWGPGDPPADALPRKWVGLPERGDR
jgi:hypothetical protein